jgi:uncharacterized protein with FMN-binding domain
MRRALLAITGLAAGTTALVVLKGAPEAGPAARELSAARPPVAPSGPAPDAPGATPTPEAPASTRPGTTAGARPSPTAGRTRAPADRAAVTARPASPRPTTAAPGPTVRTVTGPVVTNEYGNVQVQIVLSGGRIVDAVALELPQETAQSDRRSEEVDGRYSGVAGQVVRKQSADLDTVSGATATSTSYRQSLQAAIDRAR